MSELRCEPGDIAFIVNDHECPENNGALVLVERFVSEPWDWDQRPHWVIRSLGRQLKVLQIDREFRPTGGFEMSMEAEHPDDELRPIRPGDGDDEILTIAGKPEGVAA